MDDEAVMDPQENPEGTGHLPGAGEVGNGQVSYHDPVTQPTDDTPLAPDGHTENSGETGDQRLNPQPGSGQPAANPAPGAEGGPADLT